MMVSTMLVISNFWLICNETFDSVTFMHQRTVRKSSEFFCSLKNSDEVHPVVKSCTNFQREFNVTIHCNFVKPLRSAL